MATQTPTGMTLSRRTALLAILVAVALVPRQAAAAKVTRHERGFTIRTERLSATIRDGMVVQLKNLATGELHADPAAADAAIPHGMGHLGGDPEDAAKLHMPWGTRTMNQHIKAGGSYPTMHRPHDGSQYKVARIRRGLRDTWTGLTNGSQMFPEETLTVEAWEDGKTGALLVKASATSPKGGVYGVQVPLANLHADHRFYVPTFGGVMYDREMKPGLTTLGGKPFWEAPVVGIEGRKGSIGLWTEDDKFHPNFFFMNWSGSAFSVAIEHLNLMPFEPHRKTESVTWHLDVAGGGWVDAMTPYKEWYARTFAPELAARAAMPWADKIRIIIDNWAKDDPAVLRVLANTFEPETVMFHEWNARAPDFDHDLPDWTPRAGYVERVRQLHAYGFRTMAYVNTYCVNVNSPVFKRDGIAEFGLTRRKRGFFRYTKEAQSFETAKDGQLFYLDPLSPKWRTYHTDMMIRWREDTGTDANYEDVGGTVGDFGNGIVDGKFGGQGGVEQFRQLLARNPTVAMAAEYAPHSIAFAVRWPLRFQQVWGGTATRVFWMKRQRPVSSYIHGPLHLAWVPVLRAESNFLRHVVVGCSDALGGLAQFPGDQKSLLANQGILAHMKWRAQLFSRKQLKPHFQKAKADPNLACMYEDRDGAVYKYYTTGDVQRMVAPDGRDAYARITGLNRFETDLALPGWPAAGNGAITGLNPEIRYALVPGVPDNTAVQLTALPENVRISRYYEADAYTVLVLEPTSADAPATGTIELKLNRKFTAVLLNGEPVDPPKGEDGKPTTGEVQYETPFPANLVFLKKSGQKLKHGVYAGDGRGMARYILVASGLDRGSQYDPAHRAGFAVPGEPKPPPFVFLNYGNDAEVTLDFLVTVPTATSSLRVYQKNRTNKYGNATVGKLYLNGKLVRAYDLGPKPNPDWKEGMDKAKKKPYDTAIHGWTIPMGQAAGRTVLVSVAVDGKASNNADNHWWTRPKFIDDPEQKAAYVRFVDGKPVPEEDQRVVFPPTE